MKKNLLILSIFIVVLSCDSNTDLNTSTNSITGLWNREIVYLNGVNSIEYVDFLNGNSFLEIKEDKTFYRPYDFGVWAHVDNNLKLKKSARGDWTCKIIEHTENKLVLEINLTEGEYCCDFDEFTDSEIIVIKETYRKVN